MAYERPIQNLPAGISAIPSGAAACAAAPACDAAGVCAAIGRAAQTQKRRVNTNLDFIVLTKSFLTSLTLRVQLVNFSERNERRTAERSRLLILIGSPGRSLSDLL